MMERSEYISRIREAILSLGQLLGEAEAVGLCGSLARGDFSERSDIDIFVIVREKNLPDIDRIWYQRIVETLKDFKKGVSVIVYSMGAIKEICNWYVLRLASEGIILFDRGEIQRLFKRIVEKAKEEGLEEVSMGNQKIWRFKDLKLGEVKEVRLVE